MARFECDAAVSPGYNPLVGIRVPAEEYGGSPSDVHNLFLQMFLVRVDQGIVEAQGFNSKTFRISWLCIDCCRKHYVEGSIQEVIQSMACLVQSGNPQVTIEDAAFLETVAMAGAVGDPEASARAFKELLRG